MAEYYRQKLNSEKAYPKYVVTEISAITEFYKAEDYHQDYYKNNPDEAYCRLVIKPKLDKFREVFKDKLRQL